MIINRKETSSGILLIVTDSELIGKKFEEGKKQLDLTAKFYQGQEKKESEIQEMFKSSYLLHLTGEKAVSLGIKSGLVDKDKILTIKGVKHAEAVVSE
ncbi:MAG TPA: DUF424 family protein [Candidatus Nanoarchaeia archaeon]|nr:DUF424 family protein [Candidatus Nanoarchaeia archaeon]